ncbi:spore cortex-lytic enzyme [Paenibacillus sp. YYML68]|uniref:spore cortex-lytic enzyme n=1 Tax=Paenibacillus sp. YYML68 TaxID=2909250 RepID=UPI00249014EA|nr:spore cortex-lytic enzyme [Paenibacillus sp. YYML68]
MNKRLLLITISLVLVLFIGLEVKHSLRTEPTFSKNEIRYGAAGTADVYELQGRLKYLGFYKGRVDGDFGYQTLKSLKTFQSEFGLKADGIAGSKTKVKLWEATKAWRASSDELPPWAPGSTQSASDSNPGSNTGSSTASSNPGGGGSTAKATSAGMAHSTMLGMSEQDLKMMANAVYGEARGEPYVGQVAVAAVILNRVKSESFPNTVYGVIFQPRAFTAVDDGQIWLTPNESSFRAVKDAINGMDPTGGCLYYFNPVTATSKWIWTRPQVKTIGKHIFCM